MEDLQKKNITKFLCVKKLNFFKSFPLFLIQTFFGIIRKKRK